MPKVPAKKAISKSLATPDYFKLPFEVFYSQQVPVTMLDFKSDIKVEKFEDIKIVHKEQGGSWGVSFSCSKNTGPELYCCIANLHDEVAPDWLDFIEEETMEMNYGCNYAIEIEKKQIQFVDFSKEQEDEDSEEYLDVDSMDTCCTYSFFVYELGDSSPDYLILDADGTRVKVNLEGFVVDEEGHSTDERIFNPDELDEEEYEDFTRQEMWEAKFDWVISTLATDFPKQNGKLKLSFDTAQLG